MSFRTRSKVQLLIEASLCVFALSVTTTVLGQHKTLETKLVGLNNLDSIMHIVDAHYMLYSKQPKEYESLPKYKHWARWAYQMSSRTGENGQLLNLLDYTKKIRPINKQPIQKSSVGLWIEKGPSMIMDGSNPASNIGVGRVDRIVFHPTDSLTFYIGTPAGGLWKTTDNGTSWIPLSDNLPSPAVSGIVISSDNPNKIFILTGDGDTDIGGLVSDMGYWKSSAGIFKSEDGGFTWSWLSTISSNSFAGYDLDQDPNNPDVLIAATSIGIYKTTDAGLNWLLVDGLRTYEVEYKPMDSNIVYATQSGQFVRSSDGGDSFSPVTLPVALSNVRIAMAIDLSNPQDVYLVSGGFGADSLSYGGTLYSNDSGQSFILRNNSPNIVGSNCDGTGGRSQSNYDLAVGISSLTPGRMVVGGVRTWRSSSGGLFYANAHGSSCSNSTSLGYVHDDIHDVEYHPITDDVYICNDGGVVRSSDHGRNWQSISETIIAGQIYNMALSTADEDVLMLGLQDNGIKYKDTSGTTWDHVRIGDGFSCIFNNGSTSAGYLSINKNVYRFSNSGATVNVMIPDTTLDEWFPNLTRSLADSNIVMAGYSNIYRSTDSGITWDSVGGNGNWSLEASQSNNNRLYAMGGVTALTSNNGTFYRSDDIGASWTQLNTIFPSTVKWTDIGIRPNNSTNVWVTCGGLMDGSKVYFSDDSGVSWTNVSGTLPNIPVFCIAVDDNNNAYIGTEVGVYYRGNSMTDWVPFWNNLPNVPISDIDLFHSENLIYAATFGRGVWLSDMYSDCISDYATVNDLSGNKYFEVADSIIVTHKIITGANASVLMKAGQLVRLKPGFHSPEHTRFRAHIAPCGEPD